MLHMMTKGMCVPDVRMQAHSSAQPEGAQQEEAAHHADSPGRGVGAAREQLQLEAGQQLPVGRAGRVALPVQGGVHVGQHARCQIRRVLGLPAHQLQHVPPGHPPHKRPAQPAAAPDD